MIRDPKPKKRYRKPPDRRGAYYPGKLSYGGKPWDWWWHGNGIYFRNKITYINAQAERWWLVK